MHDFFFAGTGNVEKNDEINVVLTTLWWVTDTTMKYTGVRVYTYSHRIIHST